MRRLLPKGPLAYVLMTVIALLGAALAASLWRGTDTAALLQTPARPMTTPGLVSAAPDTSGLPDIKNQALFYASRKFFVEMPQATTVQLPPPAYLLEGTLLIPGKPAAAFLKHQADSISMTVHPGDALDGWKVGAVESGGVILMANTQSIEITAKGSSSIATLHSAKMPGPATPHAREHAVILRAREVHNAEPVWTGDVNAAKRPAVRVYRPPN